MDVEWLPHVPSVKPKVVRLRNEDRR